MRRDTNKRIGTTNRRKIPSDWIANPIIASDNNNALWFPKPTVVSFRLFRQLGLEHALRSLREFAHFCLAYFRQGGTSESVCQCGSAEPDGIKVSVKYLGFRVLYLYSSTLLSIRASTWAFARYSVCFADASGGFDAVAKCLALCSKASKREFRTTDRSRSSSMEE